MMIKTHIAGVFLKLFFKIMKGYPLFLLQIPPYTTLRQWK